MFKGDFMLIMGIDPGTAISGYGIVEKNENDGKLTAVDYGVIRTEAKDETPKRLKKIYLDYMDLIRKYNPQAVAIEELFYNKNAKSVIAVGQARGAAILAAGMLNKNVFEYTPPQVKQAVVGYGRATKLQIQEMVKAILGLKVLPKPDDAADALAIAICHINSMGFYKMINDERFLQ